MLKKRHDCRGTFFRQLKGQTSNAEKITSNVSFHFCKCSRTNSDYYKFCKFNLNFDILTRITIPSLRFCNKQTIVPIQMYLEVYMYIHECMEHFSQYQLTQKASIAHLRINMIKTICYNIDFSNNKGQLSPQSVMESA